MRTLLCELSCSCEDRQKDDGHHTWNLEDNQDDCAETEDGIISRCEHRINYLLRGWFPYRRLSSNKERVIQDILTTYEEVSRVSYDVPAVSVNLGEKLGMESNWWIVVYPALWDCSHCQLVLDFSWKLTF
ncbi:UNVERIFIED_CONTAM: hypothetical protein Sradi_5041500 [Sesamum radiatum]|uniref:Uncharacterized protein n=1 Tax=Sesamum radiatum TaxID=300843 RepID=A0AAW2MJG6_SESRA